MKLRWQVLFWMMISIIAAVSCGGNDPVAEPSLTPVIVEVEATDIQQTSAVLTAVVNNSKGVDDLWFELTNDKKTYTKCYAQMGEDSIFHSTVKGLASSSRYFVKAFAGNGSNLFVSSDEFSFETLDYAKPLTPDPKDIIQIANKAFRDWLLWNYDSNKDGALDGNEAQTVTKIQMFADEVDCIDEIKYFPYLNSLEMPGNREISFRNGNIKQVDVSGNPMLSSLIVTHNKVESVKFGFNPHLWHVEFCACNLEEIDMSQLTSATLVSVSSNYLSSFDARGMASLECLYVNENPLNELLVENAHLEELDCGNTAIKTLDISKCPKLNVLSCNNCPYLTTIYMAKGQIVGEIHIDSNTTIVYYE